MKLTGFYVKTKPSFCFNSFGIKEESCSARFNLFGLIGNIKLGDHQTSRNTIDIYMYVFGELVELVIFSLMLGVYG